MKKILNLTQHNATAEQLAEGVCEPTPADKETIKSLLTFDKNVLEHKKLIDDRASALVELINKNYEDVWKVLIGGAPFLMAPLERALKRHGYTPVYSFTDRVTVETAQPDGTVIKTAVFKHLGFIEAV